jgi:hypothetical protein
MRGPYPIYVEHILMYVYWFLQPKYALYINLGMYDPSVRYILTDIRYILVGVPHIFGMCQLFGFLVLNSFL